MEQQEGKTLYRLIMARHHIKSTIKLGSYLLSQGGAPKSIEKKVERALILFYGLAFSRQCAWGALETDFVPESDLKVHDEVIQAYQMITGQASSLPSIRLFREKDLHDLYRYDLNQPAYCQNKVTASVMLLAKAVIERIEEKINAIGDTVDIPRSDDSVLIHPDGSLGR